MNFNVIEKCTTMLEIVNEIVIQNYEISNFTYNKKNEDVENPCGFYLFPQRQQDNTAFDNIFYCFQRSFVKLMEDEKEENIKWDSMVLMYEVLMSYIQGKYKCKFVPHSVDEFIEIMRDMEKSKEVCKYLNGCAIQLAKNSLYCALDKNGYSTKKYYYHEKQALVEQGYPRRKFVYNNYFELDKIYSDGTDNLMSGIDILDMHNYSKGDIESVEDEVFKIEDMSIIAYLIEVGSITQTAVSNAERILDDGKYRATFQKYKVIDKIRDKKEIHNAVAIDEKDRIVFAGDFLYYGNKLMCMNDRLEKFYYIKKLINGNTCTSEIILELILSLDTEVYQELFRHLKDSRYAKYYINSSNFTLILDSILNEYMLQQERQRQIFTYNETQRKKKVNDILNKIKQEKRIKNIYEMIVEEFHLNIITTKSSLNEQRKKVIENYLNIKIEMINRKEFKIVC